MWYEIFKFEIQYRAKRWDTYLYFILLFFYGLIAVNFLFATHLNTVPANAPYLIALTMAIVSALFTMIASMIMGVAALRDFDHQMEALMFINPISKGTYLLGRFLGSLAVLLFIFSGLFLGLILGNVMPWQIVDPEVTFNLWHYWQPFLFIVLPNLFFSGALFFIGGALSRKLLVVYTQGMLFLIFYLFTLQLSQDNENDFLVALLDPFCYQTIKILVKYWTVPTRNIQMISIEGVVLYNRLLWVLLGVLTLIIGYIGFSFNTVRNNPFRNSIIRTSLFDFTTLLVRLTNRFPFSFLQKNKLLNLSKSPPSTKRLISPPPLNWRNRFFQLQYHALFYFKSILKEIPFWAIIICAMSIIFINSINLGTTFGVNSYPLTYIIVEELQEMSIFFFLMILVFYSGELIWKERDIRINELYDISPTSEAINLVAKLIGLLLIYTVLIFAIILAGILFQTLQGYYQYELSIYFKGFFGGFFPFLVLLTIVSFLFQVLANHKFMGYMLVITFVFSAIISLEVLGVAHGLYTFGAGNLGLYSDMNGYGHFWKPYCWFMLYWTLFALFLLLIAVLFYQRGLELTFKKRWQTSKVRLTKPILTLGTILILLFFLVGSYIFHNTNILNKFAFPSTQNAYRAKYEQTLKRYELIPQPKIVDVHLNVDLYPTDRNYTASGYFILTNQTDQSIPEIYVQKIPDDDIDLVNVQFTGGALRDNTHEAFGFYSFQLKELLQAGDSLKMTFQQTYSTKGFTENADTKVVYNGTFFDNFQLPTLGYNPKIALEDKQDRIDNGLSPKANTANRNDANALKESRSGADSKAINFEITLSTEPHQIAIAPGQLQKEWISNNRRYFHYKMNQPMVNFYPIISAEYEVLRDKWIPVNDRLDQPVDLEIYYHKGHAYNLDRIMQSMQYSFDYFTTNFGPYPYQQMRIVETPRYLNRAQSFPSTVTYSEGMGFIMDIDDTIDVDMPFFITAHELAHQWWGLQVAAANVQGQKMILESLAQYAALMVLKKHYPIEKTQQLLDMERARYLEGHAIDVQSRMPLATEDNQAYVYYSKGALNLYALQAAISEDSVNLALRRFIRDWNSFDGQLQTENYATTIDLLSYFREVTPDSLHYFINDLFENIILFDNKTIEGTYDKSGDQYTINLTIDANKYQVDSLGNETALPINEWLDVGVYAQDTTGIDQLIYLEKHQITKKITHLEILVNQKPSKAGLPPSNVLIDKDQTDDVKQLEKKSGL